MNIDITNEFNAIGKKLFGQRLYGPASVVFEVAAANPDNRNVFYDNFYFAYSLYYDHVNKSEEDRAENIERLKLAVGALDNVIELSPKAQDAFLFKARVNKFIKSEEAYAEMAKAYDEYITIVTEEGPESVEKNKKKLIEAYEDAGAYYQVLDKEKAKEYFTKALELDPNNEYAKQQLEGLK